MGKGASKYAHVPEWVGVQEPNGGAAQQGVEDAQLTQRQLGPFHQLSCVHAGPARMGFGAAPFALVRLADAAAAKHQSQVLGETLGHLGRCHVRAFGRISAQKHIAFHLAECDQRHDHHRGALHHQVATGHRDIRRPLLVRVGCAPNVTPALLDHVFPHAAVRPELQVPLAWRQFRDQHRVGRMGLHGEVAHARPELSVGDGMQSVAAHQGSTLDQIGGVFDGPAVGQGARDLQQRPGGDHDQHQPCRWEHAAVGPPQ